MSTSKEIMDSIQVGKLYSFKQSPFLIYPDETFDSFQILYEELYYITPLVKKRMINSDCLKILLEDGTICWIKLRSWYRFTGFNLEV